VGMLRWTILSLVSLFLLSGCAVSLFEVKYVPPPKTPRATQPAPIGQDGPTLADISRAETEAGTKIWQLNGAIGPNIQGLSSDNCAQAVELSNGDTVIDFGNIACPTTPGAELLPAESIQFTLFQEQGAAAGCILKFALMLDVEVLGEGDINICNNTPTLTELCTNSYSSKCDLILKSNQFFELKLK